MNRCLQRAATSWVWPFSPNVWNENILRTGNQWDQGEGPSASPLRAERDLRLTQDTITPNYSVWSLERKCTKKKGLIRIIKCLLFIVLRSFFEMEKLPFLWFFLKSQNQIGYNYLIRLFSVIMKSWLRGRRSRKCVSFCTWSILLMVSVGVSVHFCRLPHTGHNQLQLIWSMEC